MTRVALYARYSTDSQNAASIADQFRLCREEAERAGWNIVGTYHDAAISGASVTLRPGVQALLQDAQCGQFEVVLAEALDRISRDQADVATLYKHLRFAGIRIVTVSEGEITELHVGLKGTMNALFLKDLAAKTHRGLRGRVEQGKSGGGRCYGYDLLKHTDAAREPIRGERRINQAEAETVRRIFRDFAAGISPRSIAKHLNEEGIPGPGGALWIDTTIRGHKGRGTGLINNELYIGRLVWNRQRYMNDPSTGRRVSRINPESAWIVTPVPELRIVEESLWHAAKQRQAAIAEQYAKVSEALRQASNRLNAQHRPKALFSGLVFCGCCGGPYALRGQGRYACSAHITNGSCPNSRTIAREQLEARVLAGLRDRLMAPDAVAAAMRAYVEETNRLNHERRASSEAWRTELNKIERAIAATITAIEDGLYQPSMKVRMKALEARKAELVALLADTPADVPDVHPGVSALYRQKVERLSEALNRPEDRAEAVEALRALVERITLAPGPKRGEIDATLHGDLTLILGWVGRQALGKAQKQNTPGAGASGVSVSVVAGTGFEPVTFRL